MSFPTIPHRLPSSLGRRIAILGLIGSLAGASKAVTQEAPTNGKNPAQLDALAEKTLARWEQRAYRPVETGLLGGSFSMQVHLTGRGEQKGSATYQWTTHQSSELTWKPASLGIQLAREGWSKGRFDHEFLSLDERGEFQGCELVGRETESGVTLEVKGGESGIQELHFDSDGTHVRSRYLVDTGWGDPMNFTLSPAYEQRAGKLVKTQERFEMNMGDYGQVASESTLEYHEVQGVLVLHRITEVSTFAGQPSGENTFEFVDWKLVLPKDETTSKPVSSE